MLRLEIINRIIIITYFTLLTLLGVNFAKFQLLPFIYTTEFFLLVTSIIAILIIWQTKELPKMPKAIWFFTILVFVWACFELIYGLITNHNPVYSLRQFAPFLYLFLIPIVIYSFKTKKDINLLLTVVFITAILDGIIKLLAHITLGHYISIGIAALIGLYLYLDASAQRYKYLILLGYFILAITIFNFPTRGLWVGFIAALLVYLILYVINNRTRAAAIFISTILGMTIIGAVCGVLLAKNDTDIITRIPFLNTINFGNSPVIIPSSQTNIQWRLYVWGDMLEEYLKKPILGYGFGHKFFSKKINELHWGGDIDDSYHVWDGKNKNIGLDPHNSHLHILYMMGIIGFILFELFFLSIFIYFLRGSNQSLLTNAVLSGILFILVLANFEVVLESPYMVIYLWLFVGLILTTLNLKPENET